ncbi:MAG: capsule assembly Wzi family protein [Treponema sp.]|nr:capsule assembly Wzi family protein [Treponema sp.]
MKKICLIITLLSSVLAYSQEVLDSIEERYYDFLSLDGLTKRNYLTYRTFSDERWDVEDDWRNVWSENNLGSKKEIWRGKDRSHFDPESQEVFSKEGFKPWLHDFFVLGIDNSISYRIYGPQWFSSYNTDYPYGGNDGGLWQGAGYNTAFSGGARIEGYGFELTFRPQLSWSQNKAYDYLTSSSMQGENYAGKASEYGYTWTVVDLVQRYGEDSFWKYDWGDTEIRWTWHTFTLGFGTQAVWSGPAFYSPTLSSNNAPSYPKFDIGFRRTRIKIPYLGWYIGDMETRFWVGKLTESDYFDNDDTNDHNQISGFTFSYAPSFLKGLTLGVTKLTYNKWGESFWRYAWPGWYLNTIKANEKSSGEDMVAAITADWVFEKIGFEVYGELGFDDYTADGFKFYEYERYPFHAVSYTWGLKKTFDISESKKIRGVLQFEWNNSEASQDYQMWTRYNFGTHGQITQGKTNEGQWIGSCYGYGGNSQLLSFTLYSPHGYEKFFIQRNNPDNNYIYSQCVGADSETTSQLGIENFTAFKANFNIGIEEMWYVLPNLSLRLAFTYNKIINPKYDPGLTYITVEGWSYRREYNWANNFNFTWCVKYQF